jgi:hypothetical protein
MPSTFRNAIPSERFPVEKGRYVLYINYVCPWTHRAIIGRALKGLEEFIELIELDARDPTHGWYLSGHRGPDRDPIYGVRYLKELYVRADPHYTGRVTIPYCGTIITVRRPKNENRDLQSDDTQVPPSTTKAQTLPAYSSKPSIHSCHLNAARSTKGWLHFGLHISSTMACTRSASRPHNQRTTSISTSSSRL